MLFNNKCILLLKALVHKCKISLIVNPDDELLFIKNVNDSVIMSFLAQITYKSETEILIEDEIMYITNSKNGGK